MPRSRRRRLRFRVMAAFAGGALLLALAVAFLAYGLTRSYLLRQRETSTLRQAQVNARLVAAALRSAPDLPQLLGSLQSPRCRPVPSPPLTTPPCANPTSRRQGGSDASPHVAFEEHDG